MAKRAGKTAQLSSVFDHVRFAASELIRADVVFAHGTTDPVSEAAFIVGETLHLHPDEVEAHADDEVSEAQSARIRDLVRERIATRKPAAYLLKRMYMRGLSFYVDERVIVPRSFIGEILDAHFSDHALLQLADPYGVRRVLDLCTGSGCLAILAAHAFPNATVDAVDLSADALAVAARNVADHGLGARIETGRLVRGRRRCALRPYHQQSALRRRRGHGLAARGMPARAGDGVRRGRGRHCSGAAHR